MKSRNIGWSRRLLPCGWMIVVMMAVAACSGGGGDDSDASSADTGGDGGGGGPLNGGYSLEEFTPPESNVIVGQVVDVEGAPIAGAIAKVGDTTGTTNEEGFYYVEVTPADRIVVSFAALGYAPATRTGAIFEGGRATVNAMLVRRAPAVPVSLGEPTAVAGGAVTVEAGAVVDQAGEQASEVHVRVSAIDVTTDALLAAPGDFSASATSGDTVQLETFGMADYQLVDGEGEELRVADGESVAIELLLPIDTPLTEGEVVPAWYFDQDAGRWVEEGTGTVVVSTQDPTRLAFRKDVEHFSWWNADKPLETTCVRGTVTFCDGTPAGGADLRLDGVSYDGLTTTHAAADGTFCGLVKTNSTVDVWAASGWGQNRLLAKATVTSGATLTQTCEPAACVEVNIELPCSPEDSPFDCDDTPFAACKGCVQGRVQTPDGDPVYDAKVEVTSGAVSFVRLTDENGNYCSPAAEGASTLIVASALGVGSGTAQVVAEAGSCPTCVEAPVIELDPSASGSDEPYDFGPCLEQVDGVTVTSVVINGADPNVAALDGGFVAVSYPEPYQAGDPRMYEMEMRLMPADTTTDLPGRPSLSFLYRSETVPTAGTEYPLDGSEGDAYVVTSRLMTVLGGVAGLTSETYEISTGSQVGGGFIRFDSVGTNPGDSVTGEVELRMAPLCGPQAASVVIRATFDTVLSEGFNLLPSVFDLESIEWLRWECGIYAWILSFYGTETWGAGQVVADLDGMAIPVEPDSYPGYARYSAESNSLNVSYYGNEISAFFSVDNPVSGENSILGNGGTLTIQGQSDCYWQTSAGTVFITGFTGADNDSWLSGTFDLTFQPSEFSTGVCEAHQLTGQFGAPVCR